VPRVSQSYCLQALLPVWHDDDRVVHLRYLIADSAQYQLCGMMSSAAVSAASRV
jgi:hypothetical protein